ncbi:MULTISPECIES: hypothetical protein [unclassified Pseudomonas]|uniref:hypothetical protein n=1 Tax=unclassified Pseudomonas TaxID=196821 RepID=UPI000A200BE7|nr:MULTISPECIES: hypothetical protein [unclassified Pseudomonas]
MTAQTLLIAKKPKAKHDSSFKWTYGDIEKTAEFSEFYRFLFPGDGKYYWSISGGTGTSEAEDYFSFSFTLPYEGDESLVGTYNLENGLTCTHVHSIPAPPGFEGFHAEDADSATLEISEYNLVTKVVKGNFKALFKSHGYRLFPEGEFTLTQFTNKEES